MLCLVSEHTYYGSFPDRFARGYKLKVLVIAPIYHAKEVKLERSHPSSRPGLHGMKQVRASLVAPVGMLGSDWTYGPLQVTRRIIEC